MEEENWVITKGLASVTKANLPDRMPAHVDKKERKHFHVNAQAIQVSTGPTRIRDDKGTYGDPLPGTEINEIKDRVLSLVQVEDYGPDPETRIG